MLKLTTYRRDQFPNLKAKLEADGYTYASAMELRNTQKLASLCSEGHRARRLAAVAAPRSHQLPQRHRICH